MGYTFSIRPVSDQVERHFSDIKLYTDRMYNTEAVALTTAGLDIWTSHINIV